MLGKNDKVSTSGFFRALRSDTAGNVYAMAAAALFPIAAIIGGGVDIGRAYMAQARLQQACDAGALAGRRAMTGATMSSADAAEARKFFDFNFPETSFDTDPFTKVNGQDNPRFVDGPGDKSVRGYAQTTLNTSIMKIFGYKKMDLKVDCTSRLDIGNVDVMMVLDVTGSMDWKPNGYSTYYESEKRITGLKDAVKDFYDILGTGDGSSNSSQIRYGFMPYNAMINVGETLYDEDPSWLVGGVGTTTEDEWNYQTRRAHWIVPGTGLRTTYEQINVAGASGNDRDACEDKFGLNKSVSPLWSPSDDGYGYGTPLTQNGYYYEFSYYNYQRYSKWYQLCTRKVDRYDSPPQKTTTWKPGAVFDFWEYDEFDHDVSAYVKSIKSGNPKALRPTLYNNPSNNTDGPTDRWDGCIEERDTYANITSTTNAIPANAYDLDIDLVPSNKATRWRPYWSGVEYERNGYSVNDSTCPKPGRRLAEYASYDSGPGVDSDGNTIYSGDLKTYINSLNPSGNTNHTIGMIWGARFLSPTGLFAAENTKSKNGFNIARHLIFMTDGDLNVYPNRYNVYGYNELDGRLAPKNTGQSSYEAIQAQRFQLMCSAVKAQGVTVWVIQFTNSTTIQPNLLNCATSANHAAAATSNAALQAAFGDIAKTIGGLRLSK
ncbi:pilus assembly protein TadG-related protein [Parasphingorhabdus sp.]|uniref:pilus assembly protein TadG-related protein n=1 Tax=Parasphingorhabdus sp. TaxID=2709688 RepID=UPI002B264806|nr:pilus assembly protein TadG-related protein [Parasphingorhabdus sp.]